MSISAYGNYFDGFPKFHNIEYIYNDSSNTDLLNIWLLWKAKTGGSILYFSSKAVWWACRISKIDLSEEQQITSFVTSWIYYSRKFDMDSKLEKKKVDELSIRVDFPVSITSSVTVSYALDGSSTFTQWEVINNPGNTTKRLISLWAIPYDFYDIKIKLVVISWATGTPKIYWFKMRGEYVNT